MPATPQDMRARERRAMWACRVTIVVVLGALPTLGSCKPSRRAQSTPTYLGDFREVGPRHVDAAYQDDWAALHDARQDNPAAPAVAEAADRLLARNPPAEVRLAAMLAKAEQAYLAGEDARATLVVDQALSSPDAEAHARLVEALATVRVRAMARGADPARALVALEEPLLDRLSVEERRGLRAVALDRNGQRLEAAVAFARWRAVLDGDAPAAAYAEERFALLTAGVGPDELRELAAALPEEPARDCLRARAEGGTSRARGWIARCGRSTARVGILLPRSGRLSALADTQLAAASVAVSVLTGGDRGIEVLWRDAGSSPRRARAAAQELLADGADVLVGPIGAGNVRAVTDSVGRRVEVVVPGERVGDAAGVAPSLEARVARLVAHARTLGATRFVVAAPDNGYGRRAVKAIRASLERAESNSLIIQSFSPGTTSFAPTLSPVLPALRKGAALIVPDHVLRVEMLVRQLARVGWAPAGEGDREGALVLSTAEGASPATLGAGHDVLTGLWVCPAAAQTEASRAFVRAFMRAQGEPPGDQALLVFYALQRALGGGVDPAARPVVMRVEKGQLVGAEPAQR